MRLFDHYNQADLGEESQTIGTSNGLIPLAYKGDPPPEPEDDVQSSIGTPGAFGSGSRDHHGLVRQEPVSFTFKDPYYDGTARTLGVAETPSVYGAELAGASTPGDHRRGQPREGLTHASFFSGVGGLDLGLERAGWRTVSVSEIDPYACRVLELRFPGVPQLGSIVDLAARYGASAGDLGADPAGEVDGPGGGGPADDRPQGADDRADAGPDGRDDGAPGGPGDLEPLDVAEPDGAGEQRRAGRPVPDRRGPGADAEGRGPDVRGEHDGEAGDDRGDGRDADGQPGGPAGDGGLAGAELGEPGADDWTRAALWSGGFPCQDLSVAGKRRGMGADAKFDPDARTRSGLAFAFLDLAERHRPRFILLENVPGLLSSNAGRDMGAILGLLVELGYGVAYRVLDARHFGVPQRRRRVFILADSTGGRAGAERAAEVLSVGSRCPGHPPAGVEAGEGAPGGAVAGAVLAREGRGVGHNYPDDHLVPAGGAGPDADVVGTLGASGITSSNQDVKAGHVGALTGRYGKGADRTTTDAMVVGALSAAGIERNATQNAVAGHYVPALRAAGAGYPVSADDEGRLVLEPGAAPDPGGVREADGLARRLDDRPGLAEALDQLIAPALTQTTGRFGGQNGLDESILATAGALDQKRGGVDDNEAQAGHLVPAGYADDDEQLLPLGLDGHRYRCCGNGVVADVAEWVGERLAAVLEEERRG